jgi:hypothetical protein
MKKRLAVQGLIGVVVILVAFWLTNWLLSPFPGVSESNCDRIRPGMSLTQVQDILGGPPTEKYSYVDDQGIEDRYRVWRSGEYIVTVQFWPDLRVRSVRLSDRWRPCRWRWRYARAGPVE